MRRRTGRQCNDAETDTRGRDRDEQFWERHRRRTQRRRHDSHTAVCETVKRTSRMRTVRSTLCNTQRTTATATDTTHSENTADTRPELFISAHKCALSAHDKLPYTATPFAALFTPTRCKSPLLSYLTKICAKRRSRGGKTTRKPAALHGGRIPRIVGITKYIHTTSWIFLQRSGGHRSFCFRSVLRACYAYAHAVCVHHSVEHCPLYRFM